MANPQSEAGHTRISNELLEAILIFPLSGREMKVVMYIARETYGWSRKKASISYGAVSRYTGISRRNAIVICQQLLQKGVLFSERKGDRRANVMGIQKNYTLWKPVDNLVMLATLPSDAGDTIPSDVGDTSKQQSSDAGDTIPSDVGDTSKQQSSDAGDTRSSDAGDTTSKQKAIRLKQSENKQERLKNKAVEKAKISRLIAGNEACLSNCDPRPVIRILQKAGFDVLRVWGAVMQCKRSRITNPAGYLVKLMADPQYMPADCFLDMGKQEMLRWEQREKSALAGSVSERSVVASTELVGTIAEKFNART